MLRTAIIGAGVTGLSIANHLNSALITLFQKSRRPGGRMTTRTTRNNNQLIFDHGAHFIDPINTQNSCLIQYLKKLKCIRDIQLRGSVGYSSKEIINRKYWVGKNNMESIAQALYKNSKGEGQFNCRITQINRSVKKEYFLKDQLNKQFGPFDKVYVCLPYTQCKNIKQSSQEVQFTHTVNYQVIWTIMIAIKGPLNKNHPQIAFYEKFGGNIAKAVNQTIKNQSDWKDHELWVFNMENQWNDQHQNITPDQAQKYFQEEIQKVINSPIQFNFITAHRWLYGFPKAKQQILTNHDNSLVFCGDWVGSSQTLGQCWNLGKSIAQNFQPKL